MNSESREGRTPVDGSEESRQYLTFNLSDEVYAMDIGTVREIIQQASMTVVPLMPEFVRGVINLRGAVVPVIDLRSRFGRAPADMSKKTCVVIYDASTQDDKQNLGLLVDSVSEVIEIQNSDIEPTPSFGNTIAREYIRGLGKVEGAFIPIIDTLRALSMDDMAVEIEQHAR